MACVRIRVCACVHVCLYVQSGIFSALPFLMMWLMTLVAGAITALPVVKYNVSFTIQRKVLTFVGRLLA